MQDSRNYSLARKMVEKSSVLPAMTFLIYFSGRLTPSDDTFRSYSIATLVSHTLDLVQVLELESWRISSRSLAFLTIDGSTVVV